MTPYTNEYKKRFRELFKASSKRPVRFRCGRVFYDGWLKSLRDRVTTGGEYVHEPAPPTFAAVVVEADDSLGPDEVAVDTE